MTETTQPDPEVMAQCQRHGVAPPCIYCTSLHAVGFLPPLTVADVPAGQGPASLFIAPADVLGYTDRNAALWIQTEDGPLFIRWASKSGDSEANRALWALIEAHAPHVTVEDAP